MVQKIHKYNSDVVDDDVRPQHFRRNNNSSYAVRNNIVSTVSLRRKSSLTSSQRNRSLNLTTLHILVVVVMISLLLPIIQAATKISISDLMEQLEQDAKDFSKVVQGYIEVSSNTDFCSNCLGRNYDHCISEYPSNDVNCLNTYSNDPTIQNSCYDDDYKCYSRRDYNVSTVRLSEDIRYLQDNNKKIVIFDSVCQTLPLDNYFKEYFKNNTSTLGVPPLSLHYGTRYGMHRIYPARQSADDENGICNNYDPRIRPWYTAATNYQRNIILLLDTTMTDGTRMDKMKNATIRILESTTIADYVSILTFDGTNVTIMEINTTSISDDNIDGFYPATFSNKDKLVQSIQGLNSTYSPGSPVYSKAFETAIQLINATTIDCSTAIVLFTDAVEQPMTTINTIQSQLALIEEQKGNDKVLVFVYLLAAKQITSDTNFTCTDTIFRTGIWSTIIEEEDIVPALSNFFEVFQVASEQQQLSSSSSSSSSSSIDNQAAAWTEPYPFYTFGVIGTTVSVAVYDKSGQFMGVVGIDYSMQALRDQVNGNVDATILQKAKNRQDLTCPNFNNLSPCHFHYDTRTDTKVLCPQSTSTNSDLSVNTNTTTSNSTTALNTTNTTTDTCPSLDPALSSILSFITSDTNNNSSSTSKYCCGENNSDPTVDCTVLSSTSALWNNTLYERENYTVRACCSANATPASVSSSFFSNQINLNGQCIAVHDTDTSNGTKYIPGNPDTTTSGAPPTGESSSSAASSPGAIAGFVLISLALVSILGYVVYRRHYSSSIDIIDRPDPHPPSYTTPVPLKPTVPFVDE